LKAPGIIGIVSIIIQLIFLESLLSIDNVMVLGAIVAPLPDDQPVPYPRPLRFLQSFTDKILGPQQTAALKIGLFIAYLGRGIMLVLAAWVTRHPLFKILGAAYLFKLALGYLSKSNGPANDATGDETSNQVGKTAGAFWPAALRVEATDLVFSLDNVVVAVALSRRLWVVILGMALGIIAMRFAASLFTRLIKREPILGTAAYIVVFAVGLELLLGELFQVDFAAWQKLVISLSIVMLSLAYAHLKFMHVLTPLFHWIGTGMGYLDDLLNWALRPAIFLLKLISYLIRHFDS
jgi:tellurite resistance protein TerC